ncbi:2-oxoglutarate-Fe(II) type oxidoreductase [Lachnellula hyalina]|uniref:2-oxoglutarate-Fe(II) type oxidoreductase n=1 Tax=Lachnellula hyalina TaxID=1316788 RepID=A0A8H8QTM7_9HELO|nr:2-oxoglutarate-Fe(II) type oxidoreductase [Lachnellula hyalina]TVY22573.1 2-oxoglutarate-Fe(II) type oxidoreductase [Lachnellula hyalina]
MTFERHSMFHNPKAQQLIPSSKTLDPILPIMNSIAKDNSEAEISIPMIDFSRWSLASSAEERVSVAQDLVAACHNVGFVTLINHGVSPELLDEAFGWSKRLFDLQTEEKMLAPHPHGAAVHRGYSYPGLEKVSQVISSDPEVGEGLRAVMDCKESYEIGSEENDEQPNIWLPEETLPGIRDFTMRFYWECSKASREMLAAIGRGLGLEDPGFLLKFHSGHNNQLRLLHYPPIPAAELENGSSARMEAHSDWGSITLLFQDECGGLEVESPHVRGKFIRVTPLKNAMVVNIGDLMMRWSNDYLKSTLHRVTLPPANSHDRFTGLERMTRARYSIPYFVGPDSDAVIACMRECASARNPVKYEPVVQKEYRLMRGRLQYEDKVA